MQQRRLALAPGQAGMRVQCRRDLRKSEAWPIARQPCNGLGRGIHKVAGDNHDRGGCARQRLAPFYGIAKCDLAGSRLVERCHVMSDGTGVSSNRSAGKRSDRRER